MSISRRQRGADTNVVHRSVVLNPVGSAGSAVASGYLGIGPSILRGIHVDHQGTSAATTDIVVKADSTADGTGGVTVFTATNTAADFGPSPIGAPAIDETTAATAATDATAGGQPVERSVYVSLAQGDASQLVVVHFWFDRVRFETLNLYPVGADGAAVLTRTVNLSNAGWVRAIAVDYQNQPGTTDLIIKADSSTGPTLLTNTNGNTDIVAKPVGMPGVDEGNAAIAATDGASGGWPFKTGLYFDIAQADGQTSGDEIIQVKLWIDQ